MQSPFSSDTNRFTWQERPAASAVNANRRDFLAGSAALAQPIDPVVELFAQWRVARAAADEAHERRDDAEGAFYKANPRPTIVMGDRHSGGDQAQMDREWRNGLTAAIGTLSREEGRADSVESDLVKRIIATTAQSPAGVAAKIEVAIAFSLDWATDPEDFPMPIFASALADLVRLA